MYVRPSRERTCPHCGTKLRHGVKEEATCWKVFITCTDDRCGREYSGGSIPRSDVSNIDEVFEVAERRCNAI